VGEDCDTILEETAQAGVLSFLAETNRFSLRSSYIPDARAQTNAAQFFAIVDSVTTRSSTQVALWQVPARRL
jgi:hypothetical protein